MGGVAGPMMHLYGDPSLTYNQIKKILSAASQGEIEGTEKTDGYNIYLGYVNGKPRAARNKGDMSKGGMDFGLLAAREFKGGPAVRKVYLDAFRAYGKALETLSDKELASIFGENGEIFYNTEIQGPSAEQLVNYDANVVSMHFVGHKIYNPETDALEVIDASANSAALDRVIDRFEEKLQGESFSVRRTAALVLNRLSDDYDLNIALNKMQKAGFSGSMTIEEFLESKIMEYLDEKLGYFSDEVKQNAVDRILKKEGSLGIPQIAKGFPAAQRSIISTVIKYGPALKKKYIFPIEDAIHDFSVELLRGLHSAYILDNDAEVTRLKNEVAEAIKTIQAYTGPGAEEAHEMLYQQLKKLKHHGNINTAVEGFVFQIGDQVYKFTGNFAPANQLLGLFKYGKGQKIPPIQRQSLNEDETYFDHPSAEEVGPVTNEPSNPEDKKFLVLIPGGFKPPHLGHYNLVKSYLDHPSVERVAIVIGDLERTDSSGQVSIGFDEAVRTWKEYGIAEGPNVTFVRARKRLNKQGQDYENPMADAYDIVQEIQPSELKAGNMVIALGASTKGGDYERAVKFAKSHQPGSKYYRDGLTVTEPPVKVRAEDYTYPAGSKHAGEPISATHMRDAIAQNDLEEFKYHMPPQILKSKSDKNLQNLLDTLAGRESFEKHDDPNYDEDTSATPPLNPSAIYNIAEGLDLYHLLEKVVEDDLDVEEALEEISSMAGGSVEIGVGAGKRDNKKKQPTIFRENEDEADIESVKKLIVDFLREKGPSSYNRISHRLNPKPGPHRQLPELDAALVQLTDPERDNRVRSYYKSSYAGSIYYLVPEQQHMVPGADPQASFLQENEGVEAMEELIIDYLEEHGPSRIRDMRRSLQPMETHPGSWISAFADLKKSGLADFYYEPNGPTYWYLVDKHHNEVPGSDPQQTLPLQEVEFGGVEYDPEKYPDDMTEEDIVNYLQENGPSKEYDIYLSHFRRPPNASSRTRALANINRFLRPAYESKRTGRIDFHSAGEESPLDREYGHMGKFWYLVPEHQHLVPGSSGQTVMFEENGGVSRDQLEALKMQIIYYLLAWGPKQDKDIIQYITKQARGGHWEHISEDELRKSVFASFSELKREGKLAWRREVGSHGVKTNWWYLIPQHSDLLTQTGEQEEMFFQEDKGVRGLPGSNNPSARDADDRTNEEDPETGKTGNVGPKYKIAREQSEVDEVVNYLLDVGVFTG